MGAGVRASATEELLEIDERWGDAYTTTVVPGARAGTEVAVALQATREAAAFCCEASSDLTSASAPSSISRHGANMARCCHLGHPQLHGFALLEAGGGSVYRWSLTRITGDCLPGSLTGCEH